MKHLSETQGLDKLGGIRSEFRDGIREKFEHRARPCSACSTPGICCRDEHFVNVHITRLEAADIVRRLDELDEAAQGEVYDRVSRSIARYGLDLPGDSFLKTYACPLFEAGTGCLVHNTAKPLPCIAHACYEKSEDLPPDHLLAERELAIAALNRRIYGSEPVQSPLPLAITCLIEGRPGRSDPRAEPPAENSHREQRAEKHDVIPDR